ncbi:uncharacterized protein LOC127363690 isoform X2 [Dicentrarchus labrax]|uniref:uncharacterized protein LOC127363690 isoform X2 n=1 Tax=Dicentrarchus labrax TaxID=13489 RepID=UPI0021F64A26|nr:uncharacterized protein LOC127363690 isoform X2 [Dicentrarchus labrax]
MERTLPLQLLLVFLTSLLIFGSFASGKRISANFGDTVTFTASENCAHGDFKLMTGDNSRTVAMRAKDVWLAGKDFKHRVEHLSPSSLNFTGVNINDEGLFEFTCRGGVLTRIQLKVFSPFKLSATEGEPVEFLCRSASVAVKLLRWERNGELVCELDPSSGGIRYGTGYEGRVSVPADWKLTGDFSLTLDRVHLEDEGQFICFIDKAGTRGDPAAVMMKVNKKIPNHTISRPPPVTGTPEECAIGAGTIAGLITIVGLFIFGVIFFCLWLRLCLKSRRPNVQRGPSTPEEIEFVKKDTNGNEPRGVPFSNGHS